MLNTVRKWHAVTFMAKIERSSFYSAGMARFAVHALINTSASAVAFQKSRQGLSKPQMVFPSARNRYRAPHIIQKPIEHYIYRWKRHTVWEQVTNFPPFYLNNMS